MASSYQPAVAWYQVPKRSPELYRILALPRRAWSDEATQKAVVDLTALLRRPTGSMTLKPIQAQCLYEIYSLRGGFFPICAGGGKTLPSLLAFTVLASKRPLLLVPAKLKEKTRRAWRDLTAHWKINGNIRIESYEKLGRVGSARFLEGYSEKEIARDLADLHRKLSIERRYTTPEIDAQLAKVEAQMRAITGYRPDVIVGDEAHKLRHGSAAVSKRIRRYVEHNECVTIWLSGTMMSRSLNDIEHLSRWSLKSGSPIPHDFNDLQSWSGVIDEKSGASESTELDLGALGEVWGQSRTLVRQAFRDRLHATPGVIATTESGFNGPLVIDAVRPDVPAAIIDGLREMRNTWCTPDGMIFEDAISLWRHCRELALGFWLKWDPYPPQEWIDKRKRWAKVCRDLCEHNRSGYDSHLAVEQAIDAGKFRDAAPILAEWRAIKPTFEITTVPVWVSDYVIATAAKAEKGSLIWCENPCFGARASGILGLPYFGAKGLDARGRNVMDQDGSTSCLVSRRAVGEGFDLERFALNFVCGPMTRGDQWEQTLARTHRMKQTADEVRVDVVITCEEHERALQQALREARAQEDTTGQKQKLLLADWAFDPE